MAFLWLALKRPKVNQMPRRYIVTGSLSCAIAIIFGAFAAHGLRDILDDYNLEIFHTGAYYHLVHSLAIVLLGLLAKNFPEKNFNAIFLEFIVGIILFSGSLYILAISNVHTWGMVTPFGGIAFILAWIQLAFTFYCSKNG